MPTDIGLPDSHEYATMGNYIMDGKSFEDAVKDEGIPDNPLFRQHWNELKKGIEETIAAGQIPDFDYD